MDLIIELDTHELACRIAEATMGIKRPPGVTAEQALATFEIEDREGLYRAAAAAMVYLSERAAKGVVPS